MKFDTIVVGAGFAGSVVANVFAQKGKKVLIIEKRNHIGGNCYDYYDENGLLIHKYGPHIFHTNIKEVWQYLTSITEFNLYHHKVLAMIDGKKIPLPFNLNSIRMLLTPKFAEKIEEKLISYYGYNSKISVLSLKEIEDKDLNFLANFVYEKVFLNYTIKQWGLKPEELSPDVFQRVPIFISRNDNYFSDAYQGLPKYGYTKLFEKLLSHPNIKILLNTEAVEVLNFDCNNGKVFFDNKEYKGLLVFTGQIEDILDEEPLPYRSLIFEEHTKDVEFFQEVAVVNYPNEFDFTRITEFKHMTGQKHKKTKYFIEYPQQYNKNDPKRNIPYYPIPNYTYKEKYKEYLKKTQKLKNVYLLGRLGKYEYLNIDQVVADSLYFCKKFE